MAVGHPVALKLNSYLGRPALTGRSPFWHLKWMLLGRALSAWNGKFKTTPVC